MNGLSLVELFQRNERLTRALSYLIVSLMLTCMIVSIVQLGEYLISGWQGDYLVAVSLVIALESLYSRRNLRRMDHFSNEVLIFRAAEWVFILVGLKLLLYSLHGFNQLFADLPLWQQDFMSNFFTGEYLFAMGMVGLVWGLAAVFGSELDRLEGDERLLQVERESGITEERQQARGNIAELILMIGGLLTFLAALARVDWKVLWGDTPPLRAPVYNLLAYFVLALILLSLTQFSILRVRWGLHMIPVEPHLALRWAGYALVFLVIAALVASLLPTRYSVGLLEVLGFLLSILIAVVGLLLILLLAPFFILLALLGALFGKTVNVKTPDLQQFIPTPPPAAAAGGWVELLKSLLFWLLFAGIIGYSLVHYFKQNQELVQALRRLPLLVWLSNFWGGIQRWLAGVNHAVVKAVEGGLRRLHRPVAETNASLAWRFVNLRRLTPRQRVLFFYLAMVRRGGEQGLPRNPNQTPYEYAQTLEQQLPDIDHEVAALTENFIEARYTRHEVSVERANLVQQTWDRIKRALRRRSGPGDEVEKKAA